MATWFPSPSGTADLRASRHPSTQFNMHQPLSNEPWSGEGFFGPSPDQSRRPEGRLSYATATKTSTATATDGPPSPLLPTEIDRQHRTHILRRLEPNVTPQFIITQLTEQLELPEHELFEAVLRDPQDRRRFYCTYKTTQLKQHALGKGFTIGNTSIKPSDDTVDGYVPFPPFYVDLDSLNNLLRPYGELVSSSFVQTRHHTRVAGFKFSIKLKKGAVRPTTLSYNQCTMQVRYTDDLRICTHCRKTGHLVAQCRMRLAAQHDRETKQQEHRDQLRKIHEDDTTQIHLNAEYCIRTDYIQYQRTIRVAADVYESDLAELHQNQEDPETLLYWTAAYTEYVADLKQRFETQTDEFLEDAKIAKTELDRKYRKSGGQLDESEDKPMEVDIAQITLTTLTAEIVGEPNGDDIEQARYQIEMLVDKYIENATPAPPPPNAGEVDTVVPSSDILNLFTAITQDTVIPIVDGISDPTTEVKPLLPPRKVRSKSQTNITTTVPTMTEWTRRAPKTLDAACCRHAISFHTTTTDVKKILYAALTDTCSELPIDHPNPAEIVIQTSTTDVTHRCIYTRNKTVRDLIASLILKCHKAKTLTLKSQIELGVNPTYDAAKDDKT